MECISWTLAKRITKPFLVVDIGKERTVQSVNILFKNLKEITETFCRIPILTSTITNNF